MTSEAKARLQIDQKLEQAGWIIQDLKQINLGAGFGVAVREYPTDTGPADYVLFVNREPVGVIAAKPDNTILTFFEDQTERYSRSRLKWRVRLSPYLSCMKAPARSPTLLMGVIRRHAPARR
jgi:type I restriction enzyme, R subunit